MQRHTTQQESDHTPRAVSDNRTHVYRVHALRRRAVNGGKRWKRTRTCGCLDGRTKRTNTPQPTTRDERRQDATATRRHTTHTTRMPRRAIDDGGGFSQRDETDDDDSERQRTTTQHNTSDRWHHRAERRRRRSTAAERFDGSDRTLGPNLTEQTPSPLFTSRDVIATTGVVVTTATADDDVCCECYQYSRPNR